MSIHIRVSCGFDILAFRYELLFKLRGKNQLFFTITNFYDKNLKSFPLFKDFLQAKIQYFINIGFICVVVRKRTKKCFINKIIKTIDVEIYLV